MRFLLVAIAVLALLSVWVRLHGTFEVFSLLKPLTTIAIIALAVFSLRAGASRYAQLIVIALLFSLAGDIFLLKDERFVFGLGAFLVAHLFFAAAIVSVNGFYTRPGVLFLLALPSAIYFAYLWADLGEQEIPVAVYFAVILFMCWQAVGLYMTEPKRRHLAVAVAAVVFALSDSIIALNKFKLPFDWADALILPLYWLSITLFAVSCYYVKARKVSAVKT